MLVKTFSEGDVERMVVEITGNTVYICRPGEWELAGKQSREPDAVGFNQAFVIKVVRAAL